MSRFGSIFGSIFGRKGGFRGSPPEKKKKPVDLGVYLRVDLGGD